MENKYVLVLALASITTVGSMVFLNPTHVAQAAVICGVPGTGGTSGNPHSSDCKDDSTMNPQNHAVGNPHNSDEGEGPSHGNPHPQPEP